MGRSGLDHRIKWEYERREGLIGKGEHGMERAGAKEQTIMNGGKRWLKGKKGGRIYLSAEEGRGLQEP